MQDGGSQRIGRYQVVREIGRGGMGVVYLASDPKLRRTVAIKMLTETLADDPELKRRLEIEARALATLSDPNIATIYGVEESDKRLCIVLEYVEGDDLATVLQHGPMRLETALDVARQVASGLETAHERGVVHRDLKPANVKVTERETVKILDFGLAKAMAPASAPADASTTASTVAWQDATRPGVIMGTIGYMSPEQARGEQVDTRTDVWSFGCLLFECLTGRPAYAGTSAADVLVAICEHDPDFSELPARTPPRVRELLSKCLEKKPRQRLRHIGDARIDLERALHNREWIGSGSRVASAAPDITRLSIVLPDEIEIPLVTSDAIAISPDGSRVVFSARNSSHDHEMPGCLYQRKLDDDNPAPIAGTEGGLDPGFSPDGTSICYVATGPEQWRLVTASLDQGTTRDLGCRSHHSPVWGEDGSIYCPDLHVWRDFRPAGIVRVAPTGGPCTPVVDPAPDEDIRFCLFPEILPGCRWILYAGCSDPPGPSVRAHLVAQSLVTGERKRLLENVTVARYAHSGHLVFTREHSLRAVPFDVAEAEITGPEVVMVEGIQRGGVAAANFGFSATGTLVYLRGSRGLRQPRSMQWVDRDGSAAPATPVADAWSQPRLSPDGQRLAVSVFSEDVADVWVVDLVRFTRLRVTFTGRAAHPIWTPDGRGLLFVQWEGTGGQVCRATLDGRGEVDVLFEYDDEPCFPTALTPDGTLLAMSRASREGGYSLWCLPVGREGPLARLLPERPFDVWGAEFSPNGRFVAYTSNETGRKEVYVQSFPDLAGKWPVSPAGGSSPVWSRSGDELFFRRGQALEVVRVHYDPEFKVSDQRTLFEGEFEEWANLENPRNYDVTPDSERFLMIRREAAGCRRIEVVQNWFEELSARAPIA